MFGGQGNFWESDISRGSHQARKTELLLMTSKHLLCSLPSLVFYYDLEDVLYNHDLSQTG